MSGANTPQTPGNYPQPRPIDTGPGSWTTYDPPVSERPGYYTPYSRTTYRPTAEQLTRDEARRHYLRRNVYVPIIVAVVIVVVLFALLLVLAFGVGTPQAALFIAGLSALTVILISIPLIALMTILPIVWLAFTFNRRQQRKLYPEAGPMAYRSRVQILLWRLDGLLDEAGRVATRGGAAVTRPLVALHAWAAWLGGLARGIRGKFTRSI